MMLLSAVLAVAPIPSNLGSAWAEFSRAPAARLTRTTVEVGTSGYDRQHAQLDFWLRRTVTRGIKQEEQIVWADTRTCARVRPLLASMRDIPVPKFAPIGSSKGPPVILDGIGYSLKAYSDDGMLTESTNIGTPLAEWIEAALKTLEPCWSSRVPQRTR